MCTAWSRRNYVNSCLPDFLLTTWNRSAQPQPVRAATSRPILPLRKWTKDREEEEVEIFHPSIELNAVCRCRFSISSINLYICYFQLQHFFMHYVQFYILYITYVFHVDRFDLCVLHLLPVFLLHAHCIFLFIVYWIGWRIERRRKKNRSKTEEYHNYDGILLLLGEYFNCIAKMHGHSYNNNNATRLKRTNANECESAPAFDRIHRGLVSFHKVSPLHFYSECRRPCLVWTKNANMRSALRSQAIIAPMCKRSIG